MSHILIPAHRIEIVNIYEETGNYRETARIFNERHPERPHRLSKSTVQRLYSKLFSTGSVIDSYARGRQRIETDDNVVNNIVQEIEADHHISIRQLARTLHHSPKAVHRILKANGYKPYKYQKHQRLLPISYQDRVGFCNDFVDQSLEDPQFTSNILWSDECLFTLSGSPNKQNYR